jgi:hypothetical protein
MDAASTHETSVNFYQSTQRNIPDESHVNFTGSPPQLSQYNVWLRTGRAEFDPRQKQGIFPVISASQTGSGVHPASCRVGTGGSFPGGKARQIHPLLSPRLRKTTLLSPYYLSFPAKVCCYRYSNGVTITCVIMNEWTKKAKKKTCFCPPCYLQNCGLYLQLPVQLYAKEKYRLYSLVIRILLVQPRAKEKIKLSR